MITGKQHKYMMKSILTSVWVLIVASCTLGGQAIRLAPVFGSGMVLQRDQKIPVWGTASPGQEITVCFRKQRSSVRADKKGNWITRLNAEEYGGPDSLIVQDRTEKLVLTGVYVGEVWICSGQSNMEMPMIGKSTHVNHADEEVARANYPGIHLLKVGRNIAYRPGKTMKTGGWKVCTPENVADFSAVAYFFGRDLNTTLKMPVGLIKAAWGGTVAEAWTSGKTLREMDDFKSTVLKIESSPLSPDSVKQRYQKDLTVFREEVADADKGIQNGDTIFTAVNLSDEDWMEMDLPGMWERTSIGALDGAVWFRKTVYIPSSLVGTPLTLCFGPPDDSDEAWFNGTKVGESTAWNIPRKYPVPATLVKAGKNVITIRITDNQGDGGFMGKDSDFALTGQDGFRLKLAKNWKCKVGYDLSDIKAHPVRPGDPNQPSVLFNGMIKPLIPYAFRGVIWYQGESNTSHARQYEKLFPALITDWRKSWNTGDFPFLFVQLPSYQKRNDHPLINDSWAGLREAQRKTLTLPNTGMAITIDIGDPEKLHPGNKQDVGKRLALLALNQVYGKNIPCSGPLYKNFKVKGPEVEITFDHTYEGLKTSDGRPVTGFSIVGDDGKPYRAEATILGNRLEVRSREVKHPVWIRYAWSSNPDCNLINSAGLPASPFRVKLNE